MGCYARRGDFLTGSLLAVNDPRKNLRNAAECPIYAVHLKTEIFGCVVIANIFHYFAEAGKFFRGVLPAFY